MTTETKPAYSPGLAGVVAGETSICWVDPNAGLMYRGYDIHKVAEQANFEEVAYLLLKGELPNAQELKRVPLPREPERGKPAASDAAPPVEADQTAELPLTIDPPASGEIVAENEPR